MSVDQRHFTISAVCGFVMKFDDVMPEYLQQALWDLRYGAFDLERVTAGWHQKLANCYPADLGRPAPNGLSCRKAISAINSRNIHSRAHASKFALR